MMVHTANINVKFISFFMYQSNSIHSHTKNGLSQRLPTDFTENRKSVALTQLFPII
jgi:hypothetical protein